MPPRTLPPRTATIAIVALTGSLLLVAASKAWVCDDAYITFRTADNVLHGLGPRWNADERVQAFTHPLWMLLVTTVASLSREFYVTSMLLGLALTAAAIVVVLRHAVRSASGALVFLFVLLASTAFGDYATSGLENPLAHLLIAGFLAAWWRTPRTASASRCALLCAGLAACNRLDAVWLLAPAAWVAVRELLPGARMRSVLAAGLPLVAWELFALLYYGALVPNSALAKLAIGTAHLAPWTAGGAYVVNSLGNDPVTLLAAAAGVASVWWRRDRRDAWLGFGILLHVGWVVHVGGDFMSGRFFTPVVFAAAALLGRIAWRPRQVVTIALACTLLGGWSVQRQWARQSAASSGLAARTVDRHGIADERAFYTELTGWRHRRRDVPWPDPATAAMATKLQRDWTADPFWDLLAETQLLAADDSLPAAAIERVQAGSARPVVVGAAVGILGFDIGPRFHVLDLYALGDPLRSRLPPLGRDPLVSRFLPGLAVAHRPGHLARRIPPGYVETLVTGRNALRDPDLASYWEDVRRATRGPLFARDRWGAIWRLQAAGRDARLRRWAARDTEGG